MKELLGTRLFTSAGGVDITVGQLAFALLILVLGIFVSRYLAHLTKRRLADTRLDANALNIIVRSVFYASVGAVLLTFLALLHIPLTALAFLSGAVAIGVGFGAQAVINNFISGWILMTTRPVRIGDFVEVEGSLGTIEDIGNRSTQIRRVDGVHLLVPNSVMLDRVVINWTLTDRSVRSGVRVGVAYGSPVREVETLLKQIIEEQPDILKEPVPLVYFDDFGDNALIFEAVFWCDVSGERQLRVVRSDIRYRIDELFREHGIEIAFPQRDVHLDSAQPLQVAVVQPDKVQK